MDLWGRSFEKGRRRIVGGTIWETITESQRGG